MRTRVLVVGTWLLALALVPDLELRRAVEPAAADAQCDAAIVGQAGGLRLIDPSTLGPGKPTTRPEPDGTRSEISGPWGDRPAVMTEERRGTLTRSERREVATDEWFVASVEASAEAECDRGRPGHDVLYALLASAPRPRSPSSNVPVPGPDEWNVVLAAVSTGGEVLWRVDLPARSGYYFPNLQTYGLYALYPAAAISPSARTIAVLHSDLFGPDQLSLVDVQRRSLRTATLREEISRLRIGPDVADAKMLERRKLWSPRFLDDRYLYVAIHETRTDEQGEVSMVLIDTATARIVARWPDRGSSPVRAELVNWAILPDSVYLVTRDWSSRPYTVQYVMYRILSGDLRTAAWRSLETYPLIRLVPRS